MADDECKRDTSGDVPAPANPFMGLLDMVLGQKVSPSRMPHGRFTEQGKPAQSIMAAGAAIPGVLSGALSQSGGVVTAVSSSGGLSREELERRLALLRNVRDAAAFGNALRAASARPEPPAPTLRFPPGDVRAPLVCGQASRQDMEGWEAAWARVLLPQLQDLATTALSLILRMARGYDWRVDEVDAFEAACRAAGIEEGQHR